MSTRSLICVVSPDGLTVDHIYCHSDGYPEWTGVVLRRFFPTEEDARALIAPGDMRGFGATGNHEYYREPGSDCPDQSPISELFATAGDYGAEWIYVMEKGRWWTACADYVSAHRSGWPLPPGGALFSEPRFLDEIPECAKVEPGTPEPWAYRLSVTL